jgi:Tol biopolymer transport system component
MRVANLTVAFAAFITTAAASETGYVKRYLGDLISFSKQEGAYLLVYNESDQTRGVAVLSPGKVWDIPSEVKTFLKPKTSKTRPSLSRDRTQLAFVQSVPGGEQQIWIFDLRSGASTKIAQVRAALSVAWSPNGDALAVNTGFGELKVLVIATRQSRRIASNASSNPASWSPDGRKLTYESTHRTGDKWESHVNVVDVETGAATTVAEGSYPSWSPAGDRIAYLDDRKQVYLSIPPSGGRNVPLVKKLGGDHTLAAPVVWSPDGGSVIITAYYDGGTSMTLVDLVTSKQTVLHQGGDWLVANWR